jgi:hypothetical protein
VLSATGLEGACDGTNETLRHSLCTLVYDRDYKAPNGRGYVVLRPASDERRVYQTPLASLPDLTFSVAKPNGTLFNNSTDAMTASFLQYEPLNRLYIKIVLDQFFDRNEYWVGDYVRFSGLKLAPVDPTTTSQSTVGHIQSVEAYVNRAEGFEIVQLGASNDQGFFKSFYVLAPGMLDQENGTVVIDSNLVGVLQSLGAASGDPSATVVVASPARMINTSLQAVVTMRVGCLVGEAPSPMTAGGAPWSPLVVPSA